MLDMQNNVNTTTNNNGGESVKLLELSSSDSLDSPSFTHFQAPKPKRKVRFKKVFRSSKSKSTSPRQNKMCNCQLANAAKLLGCFMLLALVCALVWYVITLSTRIQELQDKFNDNPTFGLRGLIIVRSAPAIAVPVSSVKTTVIDVSLPVALSTVESAKGLDALQSRQQYKRMKKRKELDALVSGGKTGKRTNGKKIGVGGGSCSAHELLSSSRLESDSSDLDDFAAVLQPRRSRKKTGNRMHLATICLPLCQFVLVTTCILVSATLIWLHIGLREDLDLLRAHLQKVEAGNRNTPEALHSIHTKLKQLDSNVSSMFLEIRKNVLDIENTTAEIKHLKETSSKLEASIAAAPEIQNLPKSLNSLSESVAAFGSKINALESTVKELKDSQSSFQSTTQTLNGELDSVKAAVHELSNAPKFNSSEAKPQSSPLVRDLTFQSAIQETNQLVSYLQKELMDLVRSVDKMNSSLSALSELSTKVDTVNDAIVWIVNDTHSQNAKVYALENYVNTNLTLRVEHIENEGSKSIEKPHPHSEVQTSSMQELVNRTIMEAILKIANPDVSSLELYKSSGNASEQTITRTHNVLLLLATLLKQVSHVPVGAFLNKDNASEVISYLLNRTFHKLMAEHDSKIQDLEEKLTKLVTDHQHLIFDTVTNQTTLIDLPEATTTHEAATNLSSLTSSKTGIKPIAATTTTSLS